MSTQWWQLNDDEFRSFLLGTDATILIEQFIDSEKDEFDRDYLIKRLVESYESRKSQELRRKA